MMLKMYSALAEFIRVAQSIYGCAVIIPSERQVVFVSGNLWRFAPFHHPSKLNHAGYRAIILI